MFFDNLEEVLSPASFGILLDGKLTLLTAIGVGFFAYYLTEAVKKPTVFCGNVSFRNFLDKFVPVLGEKYWPTVWCFEARAQTVFASLLRSCIPSVPYTREIFQLSDGGEVCLDWAEPSLAAAKDSASPVVIFLPGLTGHSQSDYIKSLVETARKLGARPVVFNNRGRGGIGLKTPRTYCAACSRDLSEVLEYVKKKYPNSVLFATGISLGGMILGNYLATNGNNARLYLKAAMIVSAPWDVFKGTVSLEKPFLNRMLNRHLAACLAESLERVKSLFEGTKGNMNIEMALGAKTIREFDTHFTSKQFGFDDIEDYYRAACLHDKIHSIRVPTLCLSARDDPFQPDEAIPVEAAAKSDYVALIVTSRGGHIGFMEGFFPFREHYTDRVFSQFIRAVVDNEECTSKL